MEVYYLDVKGTHVLSNNLDCPMRLTWHPGWNCWVCLDCGLAILCRGSYTEEKKKYLIRINNLKKEMTNFSIKFHKDK